jgi:hypothetical protein
MTHRRNSRSLSIPKIGPLGDHIVSHIHGCLAAFLLVVVGASLHAQLPVQMGATSVQIRYLGVPSGDNVVFDDATNSSISLWTEANSINFTGSLVSGTLTLSNGIGGPYAYGAWRSGLSSGDPFFCATAGQKAMEKWSPTRPLYYPSGKSVYIITEGAGLGDRVRRLPWLEDKRVSDAIAKVGGISQISGTKMWIARPSPQDRDKSTILTIDWEAISRRDDNTTNYAFLPGDRLVIQQDPTNARSNLITKHTSGAERLAGIVSLTASAIQNLRDTPGSAAALREVVRQGVFDDAPELKHAIEEMIRISEEPSKKASKVP